VKSPLAWAESYPPKVNSEAELPALESKKKAKEQSETAPESHKLKKYGLIPLMEIA